MPGERSKAGVGDRRLWGRTVWAFASGDLYVRTRPRLQPPGSTRTSRYPQARKKNSEAESSAA